ncbi:hypothetical protein [Neptuniibacter caesariensis]|uniref:Uncharacterized protein n=1 Tax=Neptuniibacter caesariensis TaxID=207954 RepID=A0A7U8GS51_NEPCE|nr:hypothetical protein [Neptuniibacter caesariensis]EAR60892.1 hypothetical protein MED92_01796 [Oceanospirillum sp. MED92] [Neptuniibacter caesariensis]
MNRDDDINVPDLGPAEPSSEGRAAPVSAQPAAKAQAGSGSQASSSASGASPVLYLVMIVLVVAVSALGYYGYEMQQSLKEREATFEQAQGQIGQLEQLLKQAEQGAAQSGEALQGNVTSLESTLKQKDKQLDSEIAKLWAIAHQKNKPLIEKQAKELAALKKSLAEQGKSTDALKARLAKQESALKKASGAGSEVTKLKKQLSSEINKVNKLVARLEAELRTGAELAQEQTDELIKTQRQLSDRLVALEGKSNADLVRRVKLNEQAVRAFDGTRRQLNQDLLQVKQKLNNLQLQLEQK